MLQRWKPKWKHLRQFVTKQHFAADGAWETRIGPIGQCGSAVNASDVLIGCDGWPGTESNCRHGDFQSSLQDNPGDWKASRITAVLSNILPAVVDDAMQRAPCFVFRDARAARAFGNWVVRNFDAIKAKAEETTRYGRLRNIEQYAVGKMRFLRFDFTTGDAAGQNMVTKATRHACLWIQEQGIDGLEHFALTANLDTDKKHSLLNSLHTRGKRVVAELTLPAALIKTIMHTTAQGLFEQRQLSIAART